MSSPLRLPVPAVPPASDVPLINAPAGMGVPVYGLSPVNYWAQFGSLVFNCVDQLGIEWFFSDPDGWADGTPLALSQSQRAAAHGAWMGASYLQPRAIQFTGHVQAPSATLAWMARNVLIGVVAAMSAQGVMNVDTLFVVNEPDALKHAYVRPSDRPNIVFDNECRFTFTIPLTASDPRKYGVLNSAVVHLPVASGGLTFPVGAFPVTFGGSGTSGTDTVANDGNFVASPQVTFFGPSTNPFVTNLTTQQTTTLGIVLGSSDVLVLGCDVPTVVLNGVADRLDAIVPGSIIPVLVPGQNVFQYGASSYSSAAYMQIDYSSVWW